MGLLLAHGTRIDTPSLDDGSTALHIAASLTGSTSSKRSFNMAPTQQSRMGEV
jgi:hypothetical protein